MIQAFYKYKPASFRALALLVYADGKDRLTQKYMADMLRACAIRPQYIPPSIHEVLKAKPRKATPKEKCGAFVDNLLHTFLKGEKT